MLLSEAIWPQFAMLVFGVQTVPRFGGMVGLKGSKSIRQGSD